MISVRISVCGSEKMDLRQTFLSGVKFGFENQHVALHCGAATACILLWLLNEGKFL